jgi:hypothetical protein
MATPASPWLKRSCYVVALATLLAIGGILLGSLDYHTRWEDRTPRGKRFGGYGVDGFIDWAAWTTLLGVIALLLLLLILQELRDDRHTDRWWLRSAAIRSLLAAGCCAGAAWIARWYWQSLLAVPLDPNGELFIAGGLQVVMAAGVAGALLALMLAALLWWQRAYGTKSSGSSV